ALSFDLEDGLKNLSRLTGRSYIEEDLDAENGLRPMPLIDLAENAFVNALTQRLWDGPLTFSEVVDVLRPHLPDGHGDPVHIAKAYLSAITFVNQFAQGEVILDFRIHLFLKNLEGHLQLCVRCRRYHSGGQEMCSECGWPLFKVNRTNIREAVGKVAHRELRREIKAEPDDPQFTYLTRITVNPERDSDASITALPTGDCLSFDESAPGSNQGVSLRHADSGALMLQLIPRSSYEHLNDLVIPLVSARKDHQYLANLIETFLRAQPKTDRKLLGFIDNREAASRYVSLMGDEFASQYFEDVLSLYKTELSMRDLPSALEFVADQLNVEASSVEEQALIRDFPAWASRALSRSPRKGQDSRTVPLFMLEPPSEAGHTALTELSELQREVVELFFDERAVDKRFFGRWIPEIIGEEGSRWKGGALRAQRYLIGRHHGVHLGSAGDYGKQFSAISLGEQARAHRKLIDQHGTENVHKAIHSLVDDGTSPQLPLVSHAIKVDTSESIVHYYLKPTWIRLTPLDKGFSNYGDVRERLLKGALHSSDVLDNVKTQEEGRFQEGRLDFLIATPTLEMGVDIGQLKNVLLIGVPPLPSNYAQRAGRAGRGRKDHYALIVTFCSATSNHDQYYFDRPREMVAGYISPPSFDPTNSAVITKHVHALVLRNWVENTEAFRALSARADEIFPSMASEAHAVFGDIFNANEYVLGPLRKMIQTLQRKVEHARFGPLRLFYDTNMFPDYGFRRDEVVVIDKKKADDERVDLVEASRRYREGVFDYKDRKDFDLLRVSGRDPEQAYYRLFPGETVSMAGDEFTIGMDSPFYKVVGGDARGYDFLYGYRADDLSTGGRARQHQRDVWLTPDPKAASKEIAGIVGVTHHQQCKISFRMFSKGEAPENTGGEDISRIEAGIDSENLTMGYDLEREAISISFPRPIFADNRLAVSFLSALDRAIKDTYGLDEGDLRLIIDIPIKVPAEGNDMDTAVAAANMAASDARTIHAVLYDASGNGNAPLKRVFSELTTEVGALRRAFDRLTCCPNEDCLRGCYLCTRSYSSHFYAGDVDRSAARMVVGYLLGENAFEPALASPPNISAGSAPVVLEISLKDGMATVTSSGDSIAVDTSLGQNDALFAALAEGSEAVYEDGCQGLRVIVAPSIPYLTKLINERQPGKKAKQQEKAAFERTLFKFLRYASVRAVDHASL
ncbi:MAG TPA: hypothetical protein DCR97_03410, partial [Deltaproteobacteria bacterium]|nr:hypothetical protein [Deltaproteobacteria bacterium]